MTISTENLLQVPSRKLLPFKSGVLTLSGFSVRIRVHNGHLEIDDGVGMERRAFKLPRVGHGLKRLVCISAEGYVSLSALKWMSEIDASLVMLDRNGKVLFVTGPVSSTDARLRRAQALAAHNGTGVAISRELISQKLAGQEKVAREQLQNSVTADEIAACRLNLAEAENIDDVLLLEAKGAAVYWAAWRDLPINFPKRDVPRVPQHWLAFGTRRSLITGSTRLATNPPNAMLNYLYAILESESSIAAAALGLDPGMGFFHLDAPARNSFSCDLMEVARPKVDAFVLNWMQRELLCRKWFFEGPDGNCRLTSALASRLADTGAIWARAVAPVAESVAQTLWSSRRRDDDARLPSRLTQRHRREAKGASSLLRAEHLSTPETLCRGCGRQIVSGRFHCAECAVESSTDRLVDAARIGRVAAHKVQAEIKRSHTQQRQATARYSWRPSDQPAWLTQEAYNMRIQPALGDLTVSAITSALCVSRVYASAARRGLRRPHPRHWLALAQLTGVVVEDQTYTPTHSC